MKHPLWRCQHCGERLYGHIEGSYQCLNCSHQYLPSELEGNPA